MNKKGQLYVQSQIEQAIGKLITSIYSGQKMNNNTIPNLGLEYIQTLKDLDVQQNTNKYIWEGLPVYLPGWLIETMLYYRSSLAGWINGGVLRLLPYAQTNGINIYGLPTSVQPISFNGVIQNKGDVKIGKPLLTNFDGSKNNEAKVCILYDRIPTFKQDTFISRSILNDCLISYQADILSRIKINLQNSNKRQVFYVDDEKQKLQMQNDLEQAYGSSNPFILVVRDSANQINNEPLQKSADELQTQSLFEAWQSINSIRCMVSGIANDGAFEKKERKITGELTGDSVQADLVLNAGLKMRQLWIEEMKIAYPEYSDMLNKIKVRINEETINYDEKNESEFEDESEIDKEE